MLGVPMPTMLERIAEVKRLEVYAFQERTKRYRRAPEVSGGNGVGASAGGGGGGGEKRTQSTSKIAPGDMDDEASRKQLKENLKKRYGQRGL